MVNTGNRKEQQLDVDVLVAGGGPAGLGAALGARRMGVRTLLVERMGFLGGVGAIGLGMDINQMRPEGELRGKVHEALIGQLQKFGGVASRFEDHEEFKKGIRKGRAALVTNTEYLKLAAFKVLEEYDCDYLLHSFVSNTIVERDAVTGVLVSTKAGLLHVNAKRVVDATGDGDVCFFAGCPMAKGREGDGFLSPMTSLFVIGGVDQAEVMEYQGYWGHLYEVETRFTSLLEEGRRAGYEVPDLIVMKPTLYPGSVFVNHAGTRSHGVLDGTNPRDLTKAERIMRQQAVDVVRLLRDKKVPGFANAYLQQVSAWAGVRETRRIVGEYVLTEEDAMTAARFTDAIARRSGGFDMGFVRGGKMTPHDVPYRALIPKKIDNILASGRHISTTHVGVSCGKSMGNCMATGHAAGVAAALSIREGVTPRDLNVRLVQERLVEDGVPLEI